MLFTFFLFAAAVSLFHYYFSIFCFLRTNLSSNSSTFLRHLSARRGRVVPNGPCYRNTRSRATGGSVLLSLSPRPVGENKEGRHFEARMTHSPPCSTYICTYRYESFEGRARRRRVAVEAGNLNILTSNMRVMMTSFNQQKSQNKCIKSYVLNQNSGPTNSNVNR